MSSQISALREALRAKLAGVGSLVGVLHQVNVQGSLLVEGFVAQSAFKRTFT
jgi:hypothetical protein